MKRWNQGNYRNGAEITGHAAWHHLVRGLAFIVLPIILTNAASPRKEEPYTLPKTAEVQRAGGGGSKLYDSVCGTWKKISKYCSRE